MPQCIPKLMEYLIYIDIFTWTGHAAIYSEVDGIAGTDGCVKDKNGVSYLLIVQELIQTVEDDC